MDPFWSGSIVGLLFLYIGVARFLRHLPKFSRLPNSNKLSRDWLRERLTEAKEKVVILSGGLNPNVYDDLAQDFSAALRRNTNLRVQILTGPTILTTNGHNKLYELATTDTFGVYLQIQSLTEMIPTHFRVVDQTHLFLEDPHDFYSSCREISDLRDSAFKAWQYYRTFEYLWFRHPRTVPKFEEIKNSNLNKEEV